MRPDLCGSWRRVICGPTYAALGEVFYATRPMQLRRRRVQCGQTYAVVGEARPVRRMAKGSMRSNICGSLRRVLCGPIYAALGEGFYMARPMRLMAKGYMRPNLRGCRRSVLCGPTCAAHLIAPLNVLGSDFKRLLNIVRDVMAKGSMRPDLCGPRQKVICSPTYAAFGDGLYAVRPMRLYAIGLYEAQPLRLRAKGSMPHELCGCRRRVLCGRYNRL